MVKQTHSDIKLSFYVKQTSRDPVIMSVNKTILLSLDAKTQVLVRS